MLIRYIFLTSLVGLTLRASSSLRGENDGRECDSIASLETPEIKHEADTTPLSVCNLTGSANAEPGHVFEGVEKRIELFFDVPDKDPMGLRALTRSALDTVCSASKCTIIHDEHRECFDSYILSESSLFVFRDRVMIKTCGTTLPLGGVPAIITEARKLGLQATEMTYSRGSFLFPELQLFPHTDLESEFEYLRSFQMDEEGLNDAGESCLVGNREGSYWLVHKKRFGQGPSRAQKKVMVDCIMTGLSDEARARYFKDESFSDSENEAVMATSLEQIEPSFVIKGKCFDPCGYSCNAHGSLPFDERYFTVHITPEKDFSYASVEAVFDTSPQLDAETIQSFVQRVAGVFMPENIKVTVLSPEGFRVKEQLEFPGFAYRKTSEDELTFSSPYASKASSVVFTKQIGH